MSAVVTAVRVDPAAAAATGDAWRIDAHTDHAVILRRDGAEAPSPGDWRERLVQTLDTIQGVGIVGGQRLLDTERIHSMGELIIHPKGFHHVGGGLPLGSFQFPIEVDAVCGGVMAVDVRAFDGLGGLDALEDELGPIRFCLGLRERSWRCIVVPDVTVIDPRSPAPSEAESAEFEIQLGFDWRAADLDVVRMRHRGDGLVWNERFFGRAPQYLKYGQRPCLHWTQYRDVEIYRARADALVRFIADGIPRKETNGHGAPAVADIGCGDGLFTHLLAQHGLAMTGVDIEPDAIEQATTMTGACDYPTGAPRFLLGDGVELPFEDASLDAALLIDVIEHLPNPSRALREVRRTLRHDGVLAVVTPEARFGGWSDPIYHVCEYTNRELVDQLTACGFDPAQQGRIGEPYRNLLMLARKADRDA